MPRQLSALLVFFVCQFCLLLNTNGQGSSCPNADFEQNNFGGWVGTTGFCCPINSTVPGLVTGRHTIMTGGTDPNTDDALNCVAPGGSFSARLGNDDVNSEAEQLSYTITVDPSNALFIYRYAVVLEDPSHDSIDQPRFEIRVFDQNGVAITCGVYNVVSSGSIPGFVTITNQFGSLVHYKDWTSVGIDLSAYVGQNVTIEFSTGDCAQGAHYGYAYVDCFCSPLEITSDFCPGNNFTVLTAPPGFQSYQWSDGTTNAKDTIYNPVTGTQYTCVLTAYTGCTVTLTVVVQPTLVSSGYSIQAACQSGVKFIDSSYVVTGSQIETWHWTFGDGTTSDEHNPVHSYPNAGNFNVQLTVVNYGGCRDSSLQQITILPDPQSIFSNTTVCPLDTVDFTSLGTGNGNITSWEWNFGDASPLAVDSVVHHVYQLPGSYPVSLIITDSIGCTDTLTRNVSTQAAPVADFTYATNCAGAQVSFTDASAYTNTSAQSWSWNFGDGSPLVTGSATPWHVYPSVGTYTVTLEVTSASGCMDTIVKTIAVSTLPVAVFNTLPACAGAPLQFNDQSTLAGGSIVSWSWSFSDGGSSSLQHPLHTFATPGIYSASLTVTGSNSCTAFVQNIINVLPSPVADFATAPVCPGQPAVFNSNSTFPSGTITAWSWNFGDNTTGSGDSLNHTYTNAGTYPVTLVVTASDGCVDTLMRNVSTEVTPVAAFVIPMACEEKDVFFDNISTVSTGTIVSSSWDFGDASPLVSTSDPLHYFMNPGTYIVTLTVTSDRQCTNSIINEVSILKKPNAAVSAPATCDGLPMMISSASVPANVPLTEYHWDLGGGIRFDDSLSFSHLWPSPGHYDVQLIVADQNGCIDTAIQSVTVRALPEPGFTSTDPKCAGSSITLTDSSVFNGGTIAWGYWKYNNQSTTGSSVVINVPSAGPFPVTHVVQASNGCYDSITTALNIKPNPVSSFAYSGLCMNEPFIFTQQATGNPGQSIVSYNWNLGDGNIDSVAQFSHVYLNAGNFNVTLLVTDAAGCIDDSTIAITGLNPPVADFTSTEACPGLTTTFNNTSNPVTALQNISWSYGDGVTDTTFAGNHIYNSAGSYEVILTASDTAGCYDTNAVFINIPDRPVAAFTTDSVCEGNKTTFSNLSTIPSGTVNVVQWIFGDSSASSDSVVNHIYPEDGIYYAQLIVNSSVGCRDTFTNPVKVLDRPAINFAAGPIEGCEPLNVSFRDSSTVADGITNSWYWTFGDDSTDSVIDPDHTYPAGDYDISLSVTSSYGCIADTLLRDYIHSYPLPVSDFVWQPYQPDLIMPDVDFIEAASGEVSWWWIFDNGTTSPLPLVRHVFPTYGNYPVTLIVTSEHGCKDTLTRYIDILKNYTLWVPNAFSPNGDNSNDIFTAQGIGIQSYEMNVYNRWGELLFVSASMSDGWDGKAKGEDAKQDVYVYVIRATDILGDEHVLRGRFSLVR